MHQNLVTRFSFESKLNDMKTLEGFQQLISDYAYGSFYSIYGKFKGKLLDNLFEMEEAVFYLQNYSGQVTVGFSHIDNEIDMVYDQVTNEPVYVIQLLVEPLSHCSFYPEQNSNDFIDDENLKKNKELTKMKLVLKNNLSIRNLILSDSSKTIFPLEALEKDNDNIVATEEIVNSKLETIKQKIKENEKEFVQHNGLLNLKYKIVFLIDYKEFDSNGLIKNSVFVDSMYYDRHGENIIETNYSKLQKEKKKSNNKSTMGGYIDIPNGMLIDNRKCRPIYGTGGQDNEI